MLTVMNCLLSILLAVGGGLLGSRWIAASYQSAAEGVLSFPERREEQAKKRPLRLAMGLGFLFCFTLLTLHSMHPLRIAFLMVFQYFMLLYTWTDLEQRVIFDKMAAPSSLRWPSSHTAALAAATSNSSPPSAYGLAPTCS